jgi:DNA repair protein RadC
MMPQPRLGEAVLSQVPMPRPESVRERATRLGPSLISDRDLLTVLLGRQEGAVLLQLLDRADGLIGLARMEMPSLRQLGLTLQEALRIQAAFELSRRLSQARRRDRLSLTTPEAVVAVLGASMAGLPHEELWCLPLDPKSRLIGEPRVVSKGDVDGTDAGPRAFYRLALTAGATSAIAVHNHPGGDPNPSQADLAATRRLCQAGRIVDIGLVDHVVVGDGGRFASLRRESPGLFMG